MPFFVKALILFLVGAIAGVINALAGGGTLISFPTLIFLGVPSVIANATNTVAVQFGTLASVWSYRREFASHKKWVWRFAPSSFIGGLLGAFLLLHTRESSFRAIVPYLILFATTLFTFRSVISRWLQIEARVAQQSRHALAAAIVFQFCVGIYGGYFGAGIGILMLAVLGILIQGDIHEMNSVRVIQATLINGIAAVYFIASGSVLWTEALFLGVGAVLGGYVGPILGRKVGARVVRVFVSVFGFVTGIYFLFR